MGRLVGAVTGEVARVDGGAGAGVPVEPARLGPCFTRAAQGASQQAALATDTPGLSVLPAKITVWLNVWMICWNAATVGRSGSGTG